MTTIPVKQTNPDHGDAVESDNHEIHGDFRLFGLATFLVADGMTFAGFFCGLPDLQSCEPSSGRGRL